MKSKEPRRTKFGEIMPPEGDILEKAEDGQILSGRYANNKKESFWERRKWGIIIGSSEVYDSTANTSSS
jgi:hypothetical protein